MLKLRLFILSFFIGFCFLVKSQTTVSGVVVDEDSIPLPMSKITFVGTSNVTSSDFDGNFRLQTSAKVDSVHIES